MSHAATHDVTLGQSRIAAGETVVVWYTSANRDENVFQDPYRLDLRRSPNPHTTFGRGGPHRCLGEHLTRLELCVLLQEELLPVLPRLEPVGEPARIRSNFTNGLEHLPVRISWRRVHPPPASVVLIRLASWTIAGGESGSAPCTRAAVLTRRPARGPCRSA